MGHVNFPENNNEKDDYDNEDHDVEDRQDDENASNRKYFP